MPPLQGGSSCEPLLATPSEDGGERAAPLVGDSRRVEREPVLTSARGRALAGG